ncbi:MAG: mechanosensitive ion channel family protein [Candidatus Limnocylindrales bacterium]
MPEVTAAQTDLELLDRFFDQNFLLIALIAVALVGLYTVAPRIVRPAVRRALAAGSGEFEDSGVTELELEKRATTLEGLSLTLLRATVVASLGIIVIGVLGAWGILTGIGLFFAALTLAGQSIVLDYLMGIFIVVEGTYFKGDNISAGNPAWNTAGTVEEVGLRRTVIRGPDGTVHSISNGLMREVSNRTRVYAAGEVAVRGIREEDLDRVIELMNKVGQEVAGDPELASSIVEAPSVTFLGDPDDLGWSATMRGKVFAGQRWAVGTAIRRRLNRALLEEGIELNKRGVAPRIARDGGGSPPPYVSDEGDG